MKQYISNKYRHKRPKKLYKRIKKVLIKKELFFDKNLRTKSNYKELGKNVRKWIILRNISFFVEIQTSKNAKKKIEYC